jgi:hypothetical protein
MEEKLSRKVVDNLLLYVMDACVNITVFWNTVFYADEVVRKPAKTNRDLTGYPQRISQSGYVEKVLVVHVEKWKSQKR